MQTRSKPPELRLPLIATSVAIVNSLGFFAIVHDGAGKSSMLVISVVLVVLIACAAIQWGIYFRRSQ
jgi:hypothetical protein